VKKKSMLSVSISSWGQGSHVKWGKKRVCPRQRTMGKKFKNKAMVGGVTAGRSTEGGKNYPSKVKKRERSRRRLPKSCIEEGVKGKKHAYREKVVQNSTRFHSTPFRLQKRRKAANTKESGNCVH